MAKKVLPYKLKQGITSRDFIQFQVEAKEGKLLHSLPDILDGIVAAISKHQLKYEVSHKYITINTRPVFAECIMKSVDSLTKKVEYKGKVFTIRGDESLRNTTDILAIM